MYYTVYKITNKINGKEYIGAHKTSNLNDDYMGSGKHLVNSHKKYGLDNFSKEIIFRAVSSDIMYWVERMLVDEEYVARKDTYNLKLGGEGGFDYLNSTEFNNISHTVEHMKMMSKAGEENRKKKLAELHSDIVWKNSFKENCSKGQKLSYENGRISVLLGKARSEEIKNKTKQTFLDIGHQKVEKNSQFGTMWIYSLELKENKSIQKGEQIPDGWLKGRKIPFNIKPLKTISDFQLKRIEEKKQLEIDKELKRQLQLENKKKMKQQAKEDYILLLKQQAKEDYILLRKVGFENFKETTGYNKSFACLMMHLRKYAENYESKDHRLSKKNIKYV